jgi:hypothetical protein
LTARRPVLAAIIVGALALACSGTAIAASPQRIYKDLADNGRLDGRYSQADLARAFNLDRVVKTDPSESTVRPAPTGGEAASSNRSGRRVPFSGLDLALLTVGGGPLLLIGIGLRRRIAPAASRAGATG